MTSLSVLNFTVGSRELVRLEIQLFVRACFMGSVVLTYQKHIMSGVNLELSAAAAVCCINS